MLWTIILTIYFNIFTPNGDGVNDYFQAMMPLNTGPTELYILNRWGEVVFKTVDPSFLWDLNCK